MRAEFVIFQISESSNMSSQVCITWAHTPWYQRGNISQGLALKLGFTAGEPWGWRMLHCPRLAGHLASIPLKTPAPLPRAHRVNWPQRSVPERETYYALRYQLITSSLFKEEAGSEIPEDIPWEEQRYPRIKQKRTEVNGYLRPSSSPAIT